MKSRHFGHYDDTYRLCEDAAVDGNSNYIAIPSSQVRPRPAGCSELDSSYRLPRSGPGGGCSELVALVKAGRIPGPEKLQDGRASKGCLVSVVWNRSAFFQGKPALQQLDQLRCFIFWYGVMGKTSLPGETEQDAEARISQSHGQIDWDSLWPEGQQQLKRRKLNNSESVQSSLSGGFPKMPHVDYQQKGGKKLLRNLWEKFESRPHMPDVDYQQKILAAKKVLRNLWEKFDTDKKRARVAFRKAEENPRGSGTVFNEESRVFHADPGKGISAPVWEAVKNADGTTRWTQKW